jgi:hypothetical protein
MSTQELLQENRARGWASVSPSVPAWVRERIICFRSSVLAGTEVRMTARQTVEAETRCALAARAVSFAKRIFRPAVSEDAVLRAKAEQQGREIAQQLREAQFTTATCFREVKDARGRVVRIEVDHAAEARRKERIAAIRNEIAEIGERLGL